MSFENTQKKNFNEYSEQDLPTSSKTTTDFPNKKRIFSADLKNMMFGFGDVKDPLPESIDVVEDAIQDFIIDLTLKAVKINKKKVRPSSRLTTEDVLFLIRKDQKKYNRAQELLYMSKEIRKARQLTEQKD